VISGGKTYETKRKSLHDILEEPEQSEGVAGLKRLHRELCVATPDLFARLTNMTFIFCMTLTLTPNVHSIFHSFQFDTGQMPHALTWG